MAVFTGTVLEVIVVGTTGKRDALTGVYSAIELDSTPDALTEEETWVAEALVVAIEPEDTDSRLPETGTNSGMADASAILADEVGTWVEDMEEMEPEETDRREPVRGAYSGIAEELGREDVTSTAAILAEAFELDEVLVALAWEDVVFKTDEEVGELTTPELAAEAIPHITAGV